jgi:hypothetical protein
MSCTNCKKKQSYKDAINNEMGTSFVPKGIIIFFIVWSGFAIYGVFSLISKFL